MTTLHIEDIVRKKNVPNKYKPNSYRIFCEDIENGSLPDEAKYSSNAPPLYTQPTIVPAQAIEDRNRPHAGRLAGFIRENAHTINEPINRIGSRNVNKELEKKWWEWNTESQDDDPNWKNKKRSSSSAPKGNLITNGSTQESGFQTTYQKEHGYLNNLKNEAPNRHSNNPNTSQAVGIVPVNDLNSYTQSNGEQRVFLDKMSYEHQYDSRKDSNYPNRGHRQGAYVVDQIEPKPFHGTKVRPDANKGSSVWDAMHPADMMVGSAQHRTQIYQKNVVNPDSLKNQRRDPIGYFEDTKFGGSLSANMPNTNPGPNFNRNLQANTQEKYQPSWSNQGSAINLQQNDQNDSANDLLDQAMMYQRPLVSNGYAN